VSGLLLGDVRMTQGVAGKHPEYYPGTVPTVAVQAGMFLYGEGTGRTFFYEVYVGT